jgi:uncharacterized protein (DUF1499 family)
VAERLEAPAALEDCPPVANCVSSQAKRADRRVAPFPCGANCAETLHHLRSLLDSTRGATIVASSDVYIHAEFRTPVLRFVDDLELLMDSEERMIHVRSASRIGSWDLGVNRRRVESLHRRLARRQSTRR